MSDAHLSKSVDLQDVEADSVLNSYRHFNQWRKQQPALLYGDIQFIDTPESILAFIRQYQGERLLVCFNFSEQQQTLALSSLLPGNCNIDLVSGHKLASGAIIDDKLQLPDFGCFYSKI